MQPNAFQPDPKAVIRQLILTTAAGMQQMQLGVAVQNLSAVWDPSLIPQELQDNNKLAKAYGRSVHRLALAL